MHFNYYTVQQILKKTTTNEYTVLGNVKSQAQVSKQSTVVTPTSITWLLAVLIQNLLIN